MGANWGKHIQLSIFGESHGRAVGINISGIPAGICLDMAAISKEMARRTPNKPLTTTRSEKDQVSIMSGVNEGYTTGAPICIQIDNHNQQSTDYSYLKQQMRPGHSDYPAYMKYHGYNDVRGGGHFSGRLTAPLVFAGALCKQLLKTEGIRVISHIQNIGDVTDQRFPLTFSNQLIVDLEKQTYPVIDKNCWQKMQALIEEVKLNKDSIGGSVECAILGLPAGIGEPFFDSLESTISSLLFSIPGVKALSFGTGFDLSKMRGTQANDSYYYDQNKQVKTSSNHNGGIIGGISNGMPIVFTAGFKPTASIASKQDSINVSTKENQRLEIKGRHDPCIVLRALPVVEAMAAIAVVEMLWSKR